MLRCSYRSPFRLDLYRVDSSRSRKYQNKLYASTAVDADETIGAKSQTTNQRFDIATSLPADPCVTSLDQKELTEDRAASKKGVAASINLCSSAVNTPTATSSATPAAASKADSEIWFCMIAS
jgi:hypothetical protein